MKQSDIKRLVKNGVAVELNGNFIPVKYKIIAVSQGVYGMNGCLLQSFTGQLYAVTSRSSTLFRVI